MVREFQSSENCKTKTVFLQWGRGSPKDWNSHYLGAGSLGYTCLYMAKVEEHCMLLLPAQSHWSTPLPKCQWNTGSVPKPREPGPKVTAPSLWSPLIHILQSNARLLMSCLCFQNQVPASKDPFTSLSPNSVSWSLLSPWSTLNPSLPGTLLVPWALLGAVCSHPLPTWLHRLPPSFVLHFRRALWGEKSSPLSSPHLDYTGLFSSIMADIAVDVVQLMCHHVGT